MNRLLVGLMDARSTRFIQDKCPEAQSSIHLTEIHAVACLFQVFVLISGYGCVPIVFGMQAKSTASDGTPGWETGLAAVYRQLGASQHSEKVIDMAEDEAKKVAALEKKIQAMIKKNAIEKKLLEAAKQTSKKLDAEIKKTKKELAGEAD